jgi:hypothetical protein
VIDENPADHLRAQGKEMTSVIAVNAAHLNQLEIRFMSERARLNTSRRRTSQMLASDLAEIVVNQRHYGA